jgi:hypothetical protein
VPGFLAVLNAFEAARERAVRFFDWHAVVPRYEEIYQWVVGDAR